MIASVIVVVLLFFSLFSLAPTRTSENSGNAPVSSNEPIGVPELVPPQATDNIDDVVDSLFGELVDENAVLNEMENDLNVVDLGSALDDLSGAINENEL